MKTSQTYNEEQRAAKIDAIQYTAELGVDKRFDALFAKQKSTNEDLEKLKLAVLNINERLMSQDRRTGDIEGESRAYRRLNEEKWTTLYGADCLKKIEGMVKACYADCAALRDPGHALNVSGKQILAKRDGTKRGSSHGDGGSGSGGGGADSASSGGGFDFSTLAPARGRTSY